MMQDLVLAALRGGTHPQAGTGIGSEGGKGRTGMAGMQTGNLSDQQRTEGVPRMSGSTAAHVTATTGSSHSSGSAQQLVMGVTSKTGYAAAAAAGRRTVSAKGSVNGIVNGSLNGIANGSVNGSASGSVHVRTSGIRTGCGTAAGALPLIDSSSGMILPSTGQRHQARKQRQQQLDLDHFKWWTSSWPSKALSR